MLGECTKCGLSVFFGLKVLEKSIAQKRWISVICRDQQNQRISVRGFVNESKCGRLLLTNPSNVARVHCKKSELIDI
jgi:hypothetical protein